VHIPSLLTFQPTPFSRPFGSRRREEQFHCRKNRLFRKKTKWQTLASRLVYKVRKLSKATNHRSRKADIICTGLIPWLGYHHFLMLFVAVAIILLCKSSSNFSSAPNSNHHSSITSRRLLILLSPYPRDISPLAILPEVDAYL
jgi:hypothetical protein